MKKIVFCAAGLMLLGSMTACNNANGTSEDSDTLATTTTTGMMDGTDQNTTTRRYAGSFQPREDLQYRDLQTGRMVHLRVDTLQGFVVDAQTNQPVEFFISDRDTFHYSGNVVNNHLRYENNDWEIDEAYRTQLGDFEYKEKDGKIKYESETEEMKLKEDKMKYENENEEMKVKEDKMKYENQNTEIKAKEGKVKIERE
jgi:hypothetical protein